MRLDAYAAPSLLLERDTKDVTVVVVDLLRASTTIICALHNGVEKVVPLRDATEAVGVARSMGRELAILAGEMNGIKMPDFDLDNSPTQFMAGTYAGKSVVLTTSNGTEAIHKVRNAHPVFIGALANKTAMAQKIAELGNDTIFVCAGTGGKLSIDDCYCVGGIVSAVRGMVPVVELNDTALLCEYLYVEDADKSFVSQCHHYQKLVQLGRQDDLDLCFKEDSSQIVPTFIDGIIIPSK